MSEINDQPPQFAELVDDPRLLFGMVITGDHARHLTREGGVEVVTTQPGELGNIPVKEVVLIEPNPDH